MEISGILLSVPVLFVGSMVYAVLVSKVTDRWVVLSMVGRWRVFALSRARLSSKTLGLERYGNRDQTHDRI